MIYAVTHAPKGRTYVAFAETLEDAPQVLALNYDPAAPPSKTQKIRFLNRIQPDDTIFMALGGAGDRLALAFTAYGAQVRRIPSYKLVPRVRTIANGESEQDKITELRDSGIRVVSDVLARRGWAFPDEPARGEETASALSMRKARALALFALAGEDPGAFLPQAEGDLQLLRLTAAYRSYEAAFRASMRAVQGLLASYRDQALIAHAYARQAAAGLSDEDIHNRVLEEVLQDMLGGEAGEDERTRFFALIGKAFPEGLPAQASEEAIAKLVTAFIESDKFHATVFDRLKKQRRRVEVLLCGGREQRPGQDKKTTLPPHELWTKVFEPILGCGPMITARLITAVGDIRRFPTRPAFTAFLGYHHFEDGSRARGKRGRTSPWSPLGKQGVYLFAFQMLLTPSSPWRARLDQRKAYELVKLLRDRQAQAEKQGWDYRMFPESWDGRDVSGIQSVNDVTVEDLAALQAHIDALRAQAGVQTSFDKEDEESGEETPSAKDPNLAKLMRGLKKAAQDKALRWLGQQLIKKIYGDWREAVGLSRKPPELPRGVREALSGAEDSGAVDADDTEEDARLTGDSDAAPGTAAK